MNLRHDLFPSFLELRYRVRAPLLVTHTLAHFYRFVVLSPLVTLKKKKTSFLSFLQSEREFV